MTRWHPIVSLLVCLGVMALSCSRTTLNPDYDDPRIFLSTMQNLTLDVAYEPDAEPYTGTVNVGKLAGTNYWEVTRSSLAGLFEGRKTSVTLSVPTELSQMTAIPSQNQATWTTTEILELAKKYRPAESSATHGRFFIAFVKGYLDKDGSPQQSVIGVSLSRTSVIAVFKDVIKAMASSSSNAVAKFGEQSTLVHEMGHALGLVNNGVPLTSPHHDSPKGAHCTDDDCVMYWANEGTSDLIAAVQKYLTQGTLVLFGEECLKDAREYQP